MPHAKPAYHFKGRNKWQKQLTLREKTKAPKVAKAVVRAAAEAPKASRATAAKKAAKAVKLSSVSWLSTAFPKPSRVAAAWVLRLSWLSAMAVAASVQAPAKQEKFL